MTADSRPHPHFLWTAHSVQLLPLSLKRLLEYVWTGPDVNGAGVTIFEPLVWQARIGEIAIAIESGLQMLGEANHIIYDASTVEVWPRRWFSFHKFSSVAGRSALDAGLRRLQSKLIRAAIYEAAAGAGVAVDNLRTKPKNQAPGSPTPTPSATQQLPPGVVVVQEVVLHEQLLTATATSARLDARGTQKLADVLCGALRLPTEHKGRPQKLEKWLERTAAAIATGEFRETEAYLCGRAARQAADPVQRAADDAEHQARLATSAALIQLLADSAQEAV